jgi:hypothetical protein
MKNSASYFLGDAANDSLQRIYGISFPDKQLMADHLRYLEEAAKRVGLSYPPLCLRLGAHDDYRITERSVLNKSCGSSISCRQEAASSCRREWSSTTACFHSSEKSIGLEAIRKSALLISSTLTYGGNQDTGIIVRRRCTLSSSCPS